MLVRGFALAHVLLDHCHNGIRVFKMASSNQCHILRSVPALVKGKHLAGRDALDDVFLTYGEALCILPESNNQLHCSTTANCKVGFHCKTASTQI